MKKLWKLMVTLCLITTLAMFMFPTPTFAIQNGTHDNDSHPYVVAVFVYVSTPPQLYWVSTGVLLSSTTVLTAGHVTAVTGISQILVSNLSSFSTDSSGNWYPGSFAVKASAWIPNPDYLSYTGRGLQVDGYDVGIITLSEAITVDKYGKLPITGYDDTLAMKSPVDLVGYGDTSQIKGGGTKPIDSWIWDGYRNAATANLFQSKDVISNMFLKLTANPGQGKGAISFGDSGGPVLQAGTNNILGINTFVMNANGNGVFYAQRIDRTDILNFINLNYTP